MNPEPLMASWSLLLATSGLPEWAGSVWSVLLLVFGFSLVIFVHELGHFLAAKWAGVRVERFAIGFGRELFGLTRGETRYSFNVLPLGGYVKMLGQEDFVVDKSGELKVKDDPNSFTNKSVGRRMTIVSSGVFMNLLFAAAAFTIVVMVGRWQQPAVVGEVLPDSPAGRAGLQTGDRIVSVNGSPIRSFGELRSAIVLADLDAPLTLDVLRDGKRVAPFEILPAFNKEEGVRQIGITAGENLRVLVPSNRPAESPQPQDLQEGDELFQVIVDGEPKAFKTLAPFSRAIVAARGEPVELIVKRPKNPDDLTPEMMMQLDPPIETTQQRVVVRAVWMPTAYDPTDTITGTLLGLMPRLSVIAPEPNKSFEKAGIEIGDVITKIDGHAYPTYARLKRIIEHNPDREITIEVRRSRSSNRGLGPQAVSFCATYREELITAALKNVDTARKRLEQLLKTADMPEADRAKLLDALGGLDRGPDWRRWLERVDVHELKLTPKPPFGLFKKSPPRVEARLHCLDEDHLVVADVLEKLGDRPSPAHTAGIPVGAVILAVDGRPVKRWSELNEAFRAKAGRGIELTYRVADEIRKTTMAIPDCLTAALDLPTGARVTRIGGRNSYPIKSQDDHVVDILLPDWRVIEGILADSVGKTVEVEYVTWEGEKRSGRYKVTADNIDPWLCRISYWEGIWCYPLREKESIHNPVVAMGVGFKHAYQWTIRTIKTIRHLVLTRKVSVEKVSGPVGIARLGKEAAESGVINLLWFLGIISANLAVINFLPMPIVDGGLFLFLVLEKIRGEPVSIKTQVATQVIGIALIIALFVLVTYQDIKNWVLGA